MILKHFSEVFDQAFSPVNAIFLEIKKIYQESMDIGLLQYRKK